ncbi:MAG: dockerin type I domain-containing protein [Bacillota bacterium]|nr:dockerin type I domain-containing protein [Bacillota bacterium]
MSISIRKFFSITLAATLIFSMFYFYQKTAYAEKEPLNISSIPVTPVYGDVNMDGKVNLKDATIIQEYMAQMVTFSDLQKALADVSNDNMVTLKDSTAIQKYLLHMITSNYIGTTYIASTAVSTTIPTFAPTAVPTSVPTNIPTYFPTVAPTTIQLSGETNTYYFEAPSNWTSEGQTIACFYWSPILPSNPGYVNSSGWPGDALTRLTNIPGHDNIWECNLPVEIKIIIFNNLGNTTTDPRKNDHQTKNLDVEGYNPGDDVNYPNGTLDPNSMNNMIYVINSSSTVPYYNYAFLDSGEWEYFNPVTGEISFNPNILAPEQ